MFQIRVIEIPAQEMMDTLANQIVAIEEVPIGHQVALEAVAIVVVVVEEEDEDVINRI